MIAAIAEKVNKDQRDPCLTTSFTPVQFKVTVTPALPEPSISFSSKISSWLQSNFFPFTFEQLFFCSRLNIPWKFVLKIKTVTSLRISHKRTKLHAFTALILKWVHSFQTYAVLSGILLSLQSLRSLRSVYGGWFPYNRYNRYHHWDRTQRSLSLRSLQSPYDRYDRWTSFSSDRSDHSDRRDHIETRL